MSSALDQILLIPGIGRRSGPTEFILTVKTDNAGTSNDDQMTLPIIGGTYNVDWGDGSSIETGLSGTQTHTYPVAGTYTVRISGTFDRFNFNNGGDRQKLLTIDGLYLGIATTASGDFYGCGLPSIPDSMTLASLTNGSDMFFDNSLTSLPAGMTLVSLTNGTDMFRDNSLTFLPSGMTLESLTNGTDMFVGNTINTAGYSNLLISMEANNANNNVSFHGGSSKYNSAGGVARAALVARGWTITDGGEEV